MTTQTAQRLTAWTARRSGAGITITAGDENNSLVKVPNIETIQQRGRLIVATDKDGGEYILSADH